MSPRLGRFRRGVGDGEPLPEGADYGIRPIEEIYAEKRDEGHRSGLVKGLLIGATAVGAIWIIARGVQ